MKSSVAIAFLFALSAPALAASEGKLDTLERGTWVCEMPGDASTERGIPVPEANFEVTHSSTYRTENGRGTYLRMGDKVTVTSGPHKGQRFTVDSERMIKQLGPGDVETGLRCIKLGATRD